MDDNCLVFLHIISTSRFSDSFEFANKTNIWTKLIPFYRVTQQILDIQKWSKIDLKSCQNNSFTLHYFDILDPI